MATEPYLSEEQQIELFHSVGRRIASIVTSTRGRRVAEQIPDIANIPLLGAFVSLKRNGELRSCMGTMSDEMPLGEAIERAAVLAAREDPRFPPLAAAELFELDMEIWVLWGMKRMAQRGADRINAVTIGEHGIQISRGGNRGLLLPGVAVEYEMDAQMFLEAVCRKAGLPNDAWQDDRSLLHTFEGRCIAGPLSATENIDKKTADEMIFAAKFNRLGPRVPGPSLAETEEVRSVCVTTFRGMTDGLAPSHYFTGLFDGNVSGVSLTFQIPDRPAIVCSKISVRPDVQFQASVIELLRVLGRQVEHFGATPNEIYNAAINLAVFWDPAIHGNANRYDLSAVDTAYRALMISSPKGWLVQYDPNRNAEDLLKEAAAFLELDDYDLGEVISFETSATAPALFLSSINKPNRAAEVRPPAVAGVFYPADAAELNRELDRMLGKPEVVPPDGKESVLSVKISGYVHDHKGQDQAPAGTAPNAGSNAGRLETGDRSDVLSHHSEKSQGENCSAALVPHAGWMYSGQLAAQTLAKIQIPETVFIFAPKHHRSGAEWAVAPNRIWQLPGRSVESDLPLAEALVNAVDFFAFDEAAHKREHAVEVQLPFIARLAPNTKIVGITMALTSWEMLKKGAEAFAGFLKGRETGIPLFLISSDMNHFANEETTRRVDKLALDSIRRAVEKKKPEIALETVLSNQISMCGIVPAVFVMETLKQLGKLNRVEETGYTTSAAASSETSRTVGYAGLLFR